MLKLILCVGALALCVCCSFLLTRKYRQRFDFFYNLNLFNERLVNEVSYTKIPLPAFLEKYEFGGDFKKMLDANEVGGTALLGISKPVVKAHGSASEVGICNAVRQAMEVARSGIIDDIAQNIDKMRIEQKAE